MSRKMLWFTVVALLIALLVPLGGVSAQASASVDLLSVNGQCTPGEDLLVTFSYSIPDDQNLYIVFYSLTNNRNGNFTADFEGPGQGPQGDTLVNFPLLPVPAGTLPGDTLTLIMEVHQDFGEGTELIDADELTYTCAAPVEEVAVPGCDVTFPIPSDAVVGSFVSDAPTFYEPGKLIINPLVTIGQGNTAWVLGKDASGAYYKIIWVCQYLWVQVGTMGPNYDNVWNGTPLPTGTVE